ncbi:hypothetical protein GCM10009612_27130 [Streptomyces beijiangensis]
MPPDAYERKPIELDGPWKGADRIKWPLIALALCAISVVFALLWAETMLPLWILLFLALVAVQQLLKGIREKRRTG